MKKFFLFAFVFILNIMHSQNVNWDNAIAQIYTPQLGFASQKVLLDRVPMFVDLYNFNYPEHNVSSDAHFRQALSELYSASANQYFSDGSTLLTLPQTKHSFPNTYYQILITYYL